MRNRSVGEKNPKIQKQIREVNETLEAGNGKSIEEKKLTRFVVA